MSKPLVQKINAKKAVIGVIGLGYVGLPLVRAFTGAGLRVIGFDVDPAKVKALGAGRSYIKHVPSSDVKELMRSGRFHATSDMSELRKPDCIIICVPTPLTHMREPDMTYIESTAKAVAKTLRKGQLVVLESTTYPGTTREVMLPILEQSGLKVGRDFYLAFSPEREDPGRKDYNTKTIPKIVGGYDKASLDAAVACYQTAVQKVVPVSSCEVAEAAKILENVFRCVNIALVNELKILFDRMGIDVWKVIHAAATKPFGFTPFYPGPGLGGHCIPIDPFYLSWKARQFGLTTHFIELAGEVNLAMPRFVVNKLMGALNEKGRALKGSKVLILGLAYKKDVDDVRESPSITLIELLKEAGAEVDYNDPFVPRTHRMREHNLKMSSKPLSPKMLAGYDAVIISTDHSQYDYPLIGGHARLIIDTRNAMQNVRSPKARIVKA